MRLKIRLSMLLGIWISLLLTPPFTWTSSYYSIQVANFKKANKADQQCRTLRKKIDQARGEEWRIDRAGSRYVVRIGKFSLEKPALERLTEVKSIVPDAILWKGELKKGLTVKTYHGVPTKQKEKIPADAHASLMKVPAEKDETKTETPASNPAEKSDKENSPKAEKEARGNKKAEGEDSPEILRALLWGTILEINPMAGSSLGLTSEEKIYKLKVRVDKTEAVQGSANGLQDKEKGDLILFSDVQLPFFIPQRKIKGLVEYKGDKYKRFYWIKQIEEVKP